MADALETEEEVRQMITDIGKLTPQPIKYVVIAADHNDHNGGDAVALPATPAPPIRDSPCSPELRARRFFPV